MKRNGFAFVVTAIVVVLAAAAVALVKLRPQTTHACLNNGRPYPPEQYEKWKQEEAQVGAVVTNGSTFSNVVAILGTNFIAMTNYYTVFFADFKFKLPGMTNLSSVAFRVDKHVNDRGTESVVRRMPDGYYPFPSSPETYEERKGKNLWVSANVPEGTSFSNAVAILGTNYVTIRDTDNEFFYATFKCKFPGSTNLCYVTFDVRRNCVTWVPTPPFIGYNAIPAP